MDHALIHGDGHLQTKGAPMRIVALLKQVPDTYEERKLDPTSGLVDRRAATGVVDEINERALEVALSYKESHRGTEVVVLSMGPDMATGALRKGLSMGADAAVHVLDDSLGGIDAPHTAAVLAAALGMTGFDLVVAGNESTDGRGGVVPAMVAEILGLPHLGSLGSVTVSDVAVHGVRNSESGTFRVHAALPALISVTEGTPEARFPNFKGIMTAKRKPLTTYTAADLGLGPEALAGWGRSTILSTCSTPPRTHGVKITDEGDAGIRLADFLVAGRLI